MIPGSVYSNLHVSVCMKQINNTNSYCTCCHIYIFNPVITYVTICFYIKTPLTPLNPLQSFSPLKHGNHFVNQCTVRKNVAKFFASLCLNLRDSVIVASCKSR